MENLLQKLRASALAATLSLAWAGAAADAPASFVGCVSDPVQSVGVYSFSPAAYAPEQIKRNIYASGGGVADDKYYYAVHYEIIGGLPVVECTSYALSNWGVEDHYSNCKITSVATDLAYFAPRDEAYGCYFNESGTGYVFGRSRLSNFSHTPICNLDVALAALDFDASGQLYAIDWTGQLLKIDTATGAQTPVGSTGLHPGLITGGVIDRDLNVFYYSLKNDTEAALYKVDLATAAATKLYDLENEEQLGGLCFIPSYASAAPAASGNPSVNASNGALSGTVRFRAPQKSVGGDLLSDPVTYHIEANGIEVATGTASYSDGYINANFTVAESGNYCFSLYFSNGAGRGPRSKTSVFIGKDTPKAPGSPRLTYNGGTVKVFWTSPGSTGVNGGWIDPSSLTYRITRQPDGQQFEAEASPWSQQLDAPDDRTTFRFDVQTVSGDLVSDVAPTPEFALGRITPPFSEAFPAQISTAGWTWINNDSYIEDNYNASNGVRLVTMNAPEEGVYFATPGVKLQKGMKYEVTMQIRRGNSSATEQFEIVAGTALTPEALQANVIMPEATISEDSNFHTCTGSFEAPESDTYYIALHGSSTAGKFLYLKQVDISAGVAEAAPGAATNLTLRSADDGTLKATISFTAPSVTLTGTPLTELTGARVLRDGELLATVTENVTPGAVVTVNDDNCPSIGKHTYTVVCYNSVGDGPAVSDWVWVGLGVPQQVEWVKVKETETPGNVLVSWPAPSTDIWGTPLGDTKITYNIYDRDYELLRSAYEGNAFELNAFDPDEEQQWVQYRIEAVTESGASDLAKSMLTPVGTPDKAPWRESWANKTGTKMIGTTANTAGETWMVVGGFSYKDREIDPQDNDGGMMGLENTVPDEVISIFTGKIDLSALAAPAFSFWVYNYVGDNGLENANEFDVKVFGENDDDFVLVRNVVIGQTGPQRQWNRVIVPLDSYTGQTVRLRLESKIGTAIYVHLDNLAVDTFSDSNLAATDITAPVSVEPETDFNVSFTVRNTGDADFAAARAILLRDGVEVASKSISTLASGKSMAVTFSQKLTVADPDRVVYTCAVEADGDLIGADNTTAEAAVLVRRNALPQVSALTASSSATEITLTWNAPDPADTPVAAVTEDFDAATAWKSEVDGWTFHDIDGATIGGIGKKQLPVSGRQSFFVIDHNHSALSDANSGDRFKARSGNHALWSMYSMRGNSYVRSDDWAISPKLSGAPQVVSLWASSFKSDAGQPQYLESFEILTGEGTDPAGFTSLEVVKDVPAEWTRYEFYIPAGTSRVAIRAISYNKYILMIDDVTFAPSSGVSADLNLSGYRVWRNGVCITPEPLTATSFVDTDVEAATTYSYRVSAHYGTSGESSPSEAVEATLTTGVESVAAAEGAISARATEGGILVATPSASRVTVYTADGRLAAAASVDGTALLPVAPGIYIVSADGFTCRLLVR